LKEEKKTVVIGRLRAVVWRIADRGAEELQKITALGRRLHPCQALLPPAEDTVVSRASARAGPKQPARRNRGQSQHTWELGIFQSECLLGGGSVPNAARWDPALLSAGQVFVRPRGHPLPSVGSHDG